MWVKPHAADTTDQCFGSHSFCTVIVDLLYVFHCLVTWQHAQPSLQALLITFTYTSNYITALVTYMSRLRTRGVWELFPLPFHSHQIIYIPIPIPTLQCESKKVAPLKLFAVLSLLVNRCNWKLSWLLPKHIPMSTPILVHLPEYLCEIYHFYRCYPSNFKNSI